MTRQRTIDRLRPRPLERAVPDDLLRRIGGGQSRYATASDDDDTRNGHAPVIAPALNGTKP